MDGISEVRDIIIGGTVYIDSGVASAVVSVATVGTIEPHFKLVFSVLSQFCALAEEDIVHIFLGAIVYAVSIPWRDIETIFHVQFACSLGEVARNVGILSVLVSCIDDGVVGGGCRPEAEAIVMLHHGDAALHARCFHRLEPLRRIRLCCRRKEGYVFTSQSPLAVSIGVHAVMEEGVELRLLPLHLAIAWNRENSVRLVVGIRQRLLLNLECTLGVTRHGRHDE